MDSTRLAIIGFGEAAQAFAADMGAPVVAYDHKLDGDDMREATLAAASRLGVVMTQTNGAAVSGARAVLSLVTADQALDAASETAAGISPGAFFFDMNSVAPDTKRRAAVAVEAAKAHYVDVAVMAPVDPGRRNVPLLVSGAQAQQGAQRLRAYGFSHVRVVGEKVGAASAIKMIRSVMVKGIEALSAECVIAAEVAGVRDEVLASLDASPSPASWSKRADYNLDRLLVHGLRRAEEMEEVVKTIEALGMAATMSRGTATRQREIGRLRLSPPVGLASKLGLLKHRLANLENG